MKAPLQLRSNITHVPGVGERLEKLYNKLGVFTIEDLLLYYPRKYDDYTHVEEIGSLRPGNVTIKAHIISANGRYGRNGLHITEALAKDKSGSVRITWFNQPYRKQSLKTKTEYYITGTYGFASRRLCILNPSTEEVSALPLHTARIVAVYSQTAGLTSRQIRKHVYSAFKLIEPLPETMPASVIKKHKLVSRHEAMYNKHIPPSHKALASADRRLAFEEVFELMLASLLSKQDVAAQHAPKIHFKSSIAQMFVKNLAFQLTDSQKKVIWQIYKDIASTKPMNRLVEGDVGSGKTVVAAMAAVMALEQGYRTAYLAPTTLLANQHAETLHKLLAPLKMDQAVALLTGNMKAAQKRRLKEALKDSSIPRLLVGTHAILQEKVDIPNLGLVIVDEQHRFGVKQRQNLLAKSNTFPHLLSMTATPIPRSLSLTVFGEMDVSTLRDKPPGRKPVTTHLIPSSKRDAVYREISRAVAEGGQIYVVCPVIEKNQLRPVRSVQDVHKELTKTFKDKTVGLLHGNLSSEEKQEVMKSFQNGVIDILVSTTVIEVGVDVPNANMMLIESPEHFGLAQLHQLRGRVGRGAQPGTCYIMLSENDTVSQRLQIVAKESDGFKLAELDLKLRGPGVIYGTQQHGILDLRIASISDISLIKEVRGALEAFMKDPGSQNLVQYPYIRNRIKKLQTVVHLN